jgi:hypothetical protein
LRDTIAFVSTYSHPSRDSVEQTLRAAFPEYRFENVSLVEVVKRHKEWLVPNTWYLLKEYGRDVFARRRGHIL